MLEKPGFNLLMTGLMAALAGRAGARERQQFCRCRRLRGCIGSVLLRVV